MKEKRKILSLIMTILLIGMLVPFSSLESLLVAKAENEQSEAIEGVGTTESTVSSTEAEENSEPTTTDSAPIIEEQIPEEPEIPEELFDTEASESEEQPEPEDFAIKSAQTRAAKPLKDNPKWLDSEDTGNQIPAGNYFSMRWTPETTAKVTKLGGRGAEATFSPTKDLVTMSFGAGNDALVLDIYNVGTYNGQNIMVSVDIAGQGQITNDHKYTLGLSENNFLQVGVPKSGKIPIVDTTASLRLKYNFKVMGVAGGLDTAISFPTHQTFFGINSAFKLDIFSSITNIYAINNGSLSCDADKAGHNVFTYNGLGTNTTAAAQTMTVAFPAASYIEYDVISTSYTNAGTLINVAEPTAPIDFPLPAPKDEQYNLLTGITPIVDSFTQVIPFVTPKSYRGKMQYKIDFIGYQDVLRGEDWSIVDENQTDVKDKFTIVSLKDSEGYIKSVEINVKPEKLAEASFYDHTYKFTNVSKINYDSAIDIGKLTPNNHLQLINIFTLDGIMAKEKGLPNPVMQNWDINMNAQMELEYRDKQDKSIKLRDNMFISGIVTHPMDNFVIPEIPGYVYSDTLGNTTQYTSTEDAAILYYSPAFATLTLTDVENRTVNMRDSKLPLSGDLTWEAGAPQGGKYTIYLKISGQDEPVSISTGTKPNAGAEMISWDSIAQLTGLEVNETYNASIYGVDGDGKMTNIVPFTFATVGQLEFITKPDTLDFGEANIPWKKKFIYGEDSQLLEVMDTRGAGSSYSLKVSMDSPLHSKDQGTVGEGQIITPGVWLGFDEAERELVPMPVPDYGMDPVTIGTSNTGATNANVLGKYNKMDKAGAILEIYPNMTLGAYKTTITWTLTTGPESEE